MISAIAAIQKSDRGIGYNNDLLYAIPEDLKRFRALTRGKPMIMGRRTWESLPAPVRPLPKRPNIVVTRNADYPLPDGVHRASSVTEAIEHAQALTEGEIMVIGGAGIYAAALPYIDRLYLTIIDGGKPADTFFPSYEETFTDIIKQESHPESAPPYTFITLQR